MSGWEPLFTVLLTSCISLVLTMLLHGKDLAFKCFVSVLYEEFIFSLPHLHLVILVYRTSRFGQFSFLWQIMFPSGAILFVRRSVIKGYNYLNIWMKPTAADFNQTEGNFPLKEIMICFFLLFFPSAQTSYGRLYASNIIPLCVCVCVYVCVLQVISQKGWSVSLHISISHQCHVLYLALVTTILHR